MLIKLAVADSTPSCRSLHVGDRGSRGDGGGGIGDIGDVWDVGGISQLGTARRMARLKRTCKDFVVSYAWVSI